MRLVVSVMLLSLVAALAADDLADGCNPGSIDSTGIRVTAKTPLKVGQVLQVEWSKLWWAGKVIALLPDGKVRIHYVGWSRVYDVTVPRSRLQLDKDAVAKAKKSVRRPVVVPLPWPPQPKVVPPPPPPPGKPGEKTWNPGPVQRGGAGVTPADELVKGELLQVSWGNKWWGAKVLEVLRNGKVKIRYVGWSSSWDTVVTRDRLRFDGNPPCVIDRPPAAK